MRRFFRISINILMSPIWLCVGTVFYIFATVLLFGDWIYEKSDFQKSCTKQTRHEMSFGLFKDFWK